MTDPPPDPAPLESSHSSVEKSVTIRKKPAPPRFKLPKIPHQANHPLFQPDRHLPPPIPQSSAPALNISNGTLLKTVQDFRNRSTKWMRGQPNKQPHSPGKILKEMVPGGVEDLKGRGPYGIYIIKKIIRGEHLAYLVPHHRELMCPDRPDLYMLRLNWKSLDLKNPGVVNVDNFLIGDAICVLSLDVFPSPHGFLTDFRGMEEPKNHDFWVIGDFFLIPREFKEDCLLMKMYDGRYLVEGFVEPLKMMGNSESKHCDQGKLYFGKIFMPQLQPMERVGRVNPFDFWRELEVKPIITEVHQLPLELSDNLANFSKLLLTNQNPKSFEVLLNLVKFGIHGQEICENQIVTETYITKLEKCIVTFDTSEDWPWKIGEELFLKFESEVHKMVITNIRTFTGSFETPKRITMESSMGGTSLEHFHGKKVQIYKNYPMDLLMYFPKSNVFDEIPEDSPNKKCLVALLGGPRLTKPSGEIKVSNTFHKITFNPLQSKFFALLTSTKVPAIVVDGAFKTGKTLLAVCAANHLAHSKGDVQIVTAPTDYAVELLVNEHLSLDAPCRAVWLGPSSDAALSFGRLWPLVFWSKILEMDRNFDEEQVPILEAVVHYAVGNQKFLEENYEFQSQKLQNLVARVVQGSQDLQNPKPSLFETFLQIYHPQILFGTPSRIIEVLGSGSLGPEVRTVFFDDANRLPFHEFLALGAYCPKARFAFFGDLQQLPPSAPYTLPKLLKACAVGNLYQVAVAKLPKVTFKETFFPAPCLMGRLSRCFYDRAELPEPLEDCEPIKVLQFEALFDISGFMERLVKGLQLNQPGDHTAILSFSENFPVLGLKPSEKLFIGTVESSQNRYFDSVILLATGTPKELASRPMWNVGLSRAMRICYLLVEQTPEPTRIMLKMMKEVSGLSAHDVQNVAAQRNKW